MANNDQEPVVLDDAPEPAAAPEAAPAPEEAEPAEPPVSGGEGLAKIANALLGIAKYLDEMAAERDTLKTDLESEKAGRASDAEGHAKKTADTEAIHNEQIRMLKEDIEKALSDE